VTEPVRSIHDLPHSTRAVQPRAPKSAPKAAEASHLRDGFVPKPMKRRRSINHRAALERYIAADAIRLEGRSIYLYAVERKDGEMERAPAPFRRIIQHDGRAKVEIKDHGMQCKVGAGLVAWRLKTGDYVKRGQVVWHINGDFTDWHPDNLELLSAHEAHSRRALVGLPNLATR